MADWKAMLDYTHATFETLGKGNPTIMQGVMTLQKAGAAKGALDLKTRELISLAVAVTTRCEGCIALHAEEAAKAGATRDEILETLGQAVLMNAGAATVYSARILEAFDQFTKK